MDIPLDSLLSLPPEGVYGLINDVNKRMLVVASLDLHASLIRTIKGIRMGEATHYRNMSLDSKDIRFVLLESIEDRNSIRMRENYWNDYYRNLGYTEYYRNKNTVKYRIIVTMEVVGGSAKAIVYIQNSQRKRLLVGVFASMVEAKEWSSSVYGEGVYSLVYAKNDLTTKALLDLAL